MVYSTYSRQPALKPKRSTSKVLKTLLVGVILIGLALLVKIELPQHIYNYTPPKSSSVTIYKPKTTTPVASTSTTPASTKCSSNSQSKLVLVSISQRHLWACNGATVAYDSPVITGMAFLAADLTPTGTYHIYSKITDTVLKGHDSTGSWDDPVSYWMPFLDNQYGQYGFHDATWRPANAFGNVSPDSSNASHGCVECPLATAAWLYNWASVGTAVTIES